MKTCWAFILLCGLLLAGCGDNETVTSTKSAPVAAEKTAVVEQVKQSADDIAKQATEMVEAGTQLVKDTADDAKQAVKEVVATATEDVAAAAVVAKQKTTEIVDSSKQKVLETKDQLKQEGTKLLNVPVKSSTLNETSSNSLLPGVAAAVGSVTAPSKVATEAQITETLVIESEKGNVTLSHAEHGKLYGCASCHGDTVPGAFELGKEKAHTMCKDCHKEQGGPTKCSGCHKK